MRMFVDFLASAVEFGVNGWSQMQIAFQNFGAWFGQTAQFIQNNWEKFLKIFVTGFLIALTILKK